MVTFSDVLVTKKEQKGQIEYVCEKCHFTCFKKYSYDRHLLTRKHKEVTFGDDLGTKKEQNGQITNNTYCCLNCDKTYFSRNGLWLHKKKCSIVPQKLDDDMLVKMVLDVVKSSSEMQKQNNELQKQVLDIFKNGTMSNSHNHNNNNKTFNLQFFLNETCKDAVNIMDFVKDIKINVADLEDVGKLGYVNGISNIIIKNLKEMDVSKRPVHCSDIKREVLYIKDQDKWEKEDNDKDKFRYAIKHIAHKNIQMIPEWKKENPEYKLNDGYSNDQFMQLVMESMGGSDQIQELGYQDKIISKVAKHVVIDK